MTVPSFLNPLPCGSCVTSPFHLLCQSPASPHRSQTAVLLRPGSPRASVACTRFLVPWSPVSVIRQPRSHAPSPGTAEATTGLRECALRLNLVSPSLLPQALVPPWTLRPLCPSTGGTRFPDFSTDPSNSRCAKWSPSPVRVRSLLPCGTRNQAACQPEKRSDREGGGNAG